MSWFYLFIAGIFEMGWPLGFKLSQTTGHKWQYISLAVLSMAVSGYFLWMAQREIPIATAYIVWTGTGAIGTFVIGILVFNDPYSVLRLIFAFLVVVGIVGLKIVK